MKIIFVTGKAQSGKDTSCDAIKDYLLHLNRNLKIVKYSFADELKSFCNRMFDIPLDDLYGTNEQKNKQTKIKWADLPLPKQTISKLKKQLGAKTVYMSIRHVLIVFGTYVCRKMYPSCWAEGLKKRIVRENVDYALICDARYPDELDIFHDKNPYVIRLTRNILKIKDISETALDKYDWAKFERFALVDNSNTDLNEKNETILAISKEWGI